MVSATGGTRRERVELAFDACLFTAALFALAASVLLGVAALAGGNDLPIWMQLVSSLVVLATGIGGPVATWLLHGRRIAPIAVLGAFLGAGVAGLLTASAALVSMPLAWLVSPISRSEFAGPVALLTLIAAAFVVAMAWLLFDAARDLSPRRRAHRLLDILRLVSAGVLVVYSGAISVSATRSPTGEIAEAVIFALVAGIAAGVIVAVADAMTTLVGRKPDAAAS